VLIALATGACFVLACWLFARDLGRSYQRVHALARLPSEIALSMTVRYARGMIAREEYRMNDNNGLSSAVYRVTGRSGMRVRIESLPHADYDVSFLFGKVVRDGIWELPGVPPRGDTSVSYEVTVAQSIDGHHGAHTIHFTDPHYWATTAGRMYHIRLDKNKPVPDLLLLRSTSSSEPRYERVVKDMRSFGSYALQEKIASARARLSESHSKRTSDR
jgi:hypothetical protein